MIVGWAAAQSPYLLPGELTVDEAAAGDATLTALVVSVGAGLLLLAPSLVLLYRLVLRGRVHLAFVVWGLFLIATPELPRREAGQASPIDRRGNAMEPAGEAP